MNFDHAESAVLATVHTAMPQGYALPALNHKGLPDFEVTPKEAREACNRLRLRGFVAKVGPLRTAHRPGHGAVRRPGRDDLGSQS